MRSYIGTSGFQYKGWSDQFYQDTPQKRWLEYYAEHFNSVEINNSFYRLPQTKTFQSWADRTPSDFRYAIKGSRYITHLIRLQDPEPHVKLFFDHAKALGDKLGVTLWQLPESLKFNADKLQIFAKTLSAYGLGRQALEVRHESWFCDQAYQTLSSHNIALVIAHSDKWPYRDNVVTADFLYLRFHGAPKLYTSNYSQESLRLWAEKTANLKPTIVYAYFNNDANVHAPDNAKTFRELLQKISS